MSKTVEIKDVPLDLPKERKPIERSGTLQKLAQHDSSKKLTSAIKSGGKENFQHFCFTLVCLVIVSGFIGAPGAIILSI